jgi:outer membrane protein assembly factor BamB
MRIVLSMLIGVAGVAATALAQPGIESPAANWSCFRGPAQGVSPWDNAPTEWDGSSGKGVLWKTRLELSGVSSPVLWGDHVYLTEGTDRERALLAFDAATGKQLWRQVITHGGKGTVPAVSDAGLALPTPTCDADGVYALYGTGDLAAFTHEGKPRWTLFVQKPQIGYGFASSPIVAQGLVLVQFDCLADGRILAVEAGTGKIRWEVSRAHSAVWSSPILIPAADGKPLMVVNGSGSITAIDLDGNLVWDLDGVTGEISPSPAYTGGRIYAVNQGSMVLCLRAAGSPGEAWRYLDHLSDTASPVAAHELLFVAGADGQLACLDAATGKDQWTYQLGSCYASLVVSGDRVYAVDRTGVTHIVAAERALRVIAKCDLGEGSDATPAFSDGRMYIRTRSHLWCLGAK